MIKSFFIMVALAMGVTLMLLVSLKHTKGDFDVYYQASHHYLNKAPVYLPHGGIEEFKYSPLFALLFLPFVLMPLGVSIYLWTFINIIILYAIVGVFYKLNLINFSSFKDFLIMMCLLALSGRYIFADIKLGQVNLLLVLLMALVMYFEIKGKDFWAALFLSASLMIKFFPLLFVFYFIIRKRFKLLLYTGLMICFFLILPSVYTGFSLNMRYMHDWFKLLQSTPPILLYSVKNYSILSFFSWFFIARHQNYYIFDYDLIKLGLTPQVYYAWALSCFVILMAYFYDVFLVKARNEGLVYLDYSCLFICALLFNPLAYLNALTFLIVPYFFILRSLFYSGLKERFSFLSLVFLLISFLLTMLDNRFFFRDIHLFYSVLELRPLMWAILFAYLSLLFAKVSMIKSAQSPSLS